MSFNPLEGGGRRILMISLKTTAVAVAGSPAVPMAGPANAGVRHPATGAAVTDGATVARWPVDKVSRYSICTTSASLVQNEYRRYYRITESCRFNEAYNGVVFFYNQR
jgi:hypothetical protein